MKSLPQRKSPRLQGYDYAQAGAYFVTICTYQRLCLFGRVRDGAMILSDMGQIAQERWCALPEHHPYVELDAFVVMPNHVHGIIVMVGTTPALSVAVDRAGAVPTLGTVIGAYKSGVTRRIREQNRAADGQIWQGRYHDHILRNERDLHRIRDYILHNPACWPQDSLFN